MINLHQKSLDYRDINLDTFLSNLQGNILKGHGRDNTVHILVTFKADKINEAKAWIKTFANEKLTTFKEQLRQRELFKRNQKPGALFASIYFTQSFYKYLGKDIKVFEDTFQKGMKNKIDLFDPPVTDWEPEYDQEIHAMILLGHGDISELGEASATIIEELENEKHPELSIANIVTLEYGSAIRNASGDGLEHFGYVDGISQPLFLKDEVDKYNTDNLAPLHFDPAAELDLVLLKDPHTSSDDCCGSYFVYRKLEQHVRGFKEAEKILAKNLDLEDEDKERAGAMIIGRFEDGTPVTLNGTDKMIASGVMNNFNYTESIGGHDDSHGERCPFHGHIRKANPRRDNADKKHIMARRGIPYGHRNVSTTIEQTFVQMPERGVGLLFMSFQKSIANQFEFIQKNWVNKTGFPKQTTGIDDVIGQGTGSRKGHYAKVYNDKTTLKDPAFPNFVNLKGGEYFFAPSIPFLKSL
ncbi:MAG TPA: hypothetical protein VGP55_10915 [Chitinophagaceae bacterium]|nr:hypothetical protein [Chitinophagaceae bacterium]